LRVFLLFMNKKMNLKINKNKKSLVKTVLTQFSNLQVGPVETSSSLPQ